MKKAFIVRLDPSLHTKFKNKCIAEDVKMVEKIKAWVKRWVRT